MSGDIAGHGIVYTASCCKKCCTIRALCSLALSSMKLACQRTHDLDYSHMGTGPLVWWKSFFATPYRRSCKGLAPTKHFISGQRQRTHDCQNGGLRVERAHCHGIFGLSDYHKERTSPTYSQRKNNPRQLHPTPKSSCAQNVVVLKWSVLLAPNPWRRVTELHNKRGGYTRYWFLCLTHTHTRCI
jgi:hypothetical protein